MENEWVRELERLRAENARMYQLIYDMVVFLKKIEEHTKGEFNASKNPHQHNYPGEGVPSR
jgi:hypothetical protein